MRTTQARIAVCGCVIGVMLIGVCVVGLADWVYVVRCISEENPNMETSINIMNPHSFSVDFTYRFAWYLQSGDVVACADDAWMEHLGEIGANATFNISNTTMVDEYIWHLLGDRDPLPHEVWNGERLEGVALIRTRSPLISVGVVYTLKGNGGMGGSIDVEYITPIEVHDYKVPWSW